MEFNFSPTCNHDPGNNWYKSNIGDPSLPLKGHQISKHGGEKRRGCTDGLIEGDREIPKRNVATDNRGTEYNAESGNLEELSPRFKGLQRRNFQENNGDVTENCTSRHVAHCEEDWEAEAIVGEQKLVEKNDPNVG